MKLDINAGRTEKIFEVDLLHGITWTSMPYYFLQSKDVILSSGKISFEKDKPISYEKISTSAKITPETFLRRFIFLHFPSSPNALYDSIGLGIDTFDKDLPFINQLYENGEIEKRVFGFNMSFLDRGEIIFGDISEEFQKIYKYNATCSVYNKLWGCKLNTVVFNDIIYYNDDLLYFQSQNTNIYAPKKFINFIFEKYFKNLEGEKYRCQFFKGIMLRCPCEIISPFPKIELHFEGVTVTLNEDLVFQKYQDECIFRIEASEDEKSWVIGSYFMKIFPVLFDFDKEEITLYDNLGLLRTKEPPSNSKNSKISFIIFFNLFLMIFAICLLICSKRVNKRV